MRILLVTDAWLPQVNGVVRTIQSTIAELQKFGHDVHVIHPGLDFRTIPTPSYPEIRLAMFAARRVGRMIEHIRPDAIHIVTEGTLGGSARRWCRRHRVPFTTSYCTKFPEYIKARYRTPLWLGYWWFRRFHKDARACSVNTPTMRTELETRGFANLTIWTRGVDVDLFRPRPGDDILDHLERPIFGCIGRVAVEKNIHAFLAADLPGSKVVVGGGPQLDQLKRQYPGAHFVGMKQAEELARHYAALDVFCFPSLTDTFGLVMLEALASGTPVAAHPVAGPLDVILDPNVGVLHDDLATAARAALALDPANGRPYALDYSWTKVAQIMLDFLAPIPSDHPRLSWTPTGSKAAATQGGS